MTAIRQDRRDWLAAVGIAMGLVAIVILFGATLFLNIQVRHTQEDNQRVLMEVHAQTAAIAKVLKDANDVGPALTTGQAQIISGLHAICTATPGCVWNPPTPVP